MTADQPDSETIHASCVAIDGLAVLLCGASGSGKSDLTLCLLDRGAKLISDDYTVLRRSGDELVASAPANIAGKIEVRGIGIVDWPAISGVPVALCFALDTPVERMPQEQPGHRTILGVPVPVVALEALHASAPIKAELAVRGIVDALHNKEGR